MIANPNLWVIVILKQFCVYKMILRKSIYDVHANLCLSRSVEVQTLLYTYVKVEKLLNLRGNKIKIFTNHAILIKLLYWSWFYCMGCNLKNKVIIFLFFLRDVKKCTVNLIKPEIL